MEEETNGMRNCTRTRINAYDKR